MKALSDEEKDKTWGILDKAAINGEKSFIKSLQTFFSGQQVRLNKALSKGYTLKAIEDVDDMLNWKEEDRILFATLNPEWKANFMEGVTTVNELYDFGMSDKLLNPKFLDWVKQMGAEQVKGINDTTKEALRKEIQTGIEEGEGIPQIRKRVEDVFNLAKGSRATMIARTETHNSVSTGTFETYKAAEVKQKEWLSTSDSRTRDSHADINRQVRDMNQPFSNGLMFPGDFRGPASEVINCRCTLLPIIEE